MLGIRTRGRRMVGADETMELWRPPTINCSLAVHSNYVLALLMICGKLGKCFHGEINDGAITGIWNTHLKLCSPKLTKEKHF